ncbi:MAG TPA: IS630 family transposase, partial [Longimicrobiaceae bacterium]
AVAQEVAAWEANRNQSRATIRWRFTTADARTKLHRFYPSETQ